MNLLTGVLEPTKGEWRKNHRLVCIVLCTICYNSFRLYVFTFSYILTFSEDGQIWSTFWRTFDWYENSLLVKVKCLKNTITLLLSHVYFFISAEESPVEYLVRLFDLQYEKVCAYIILIIFISYHDHFHVLRPFEYLNTNYAAGKERTWIFWSSWLCTYDKNERLVWWTEGSSCTCGTKIEWSGCFNIGKRMFNTFWYFWSRYLQTWLYCQVHYKWIVVSACVQNWFPFAFARVVAIYCNILATQDRKGTFSLFRNFTLNVYYRM